MLLLMVPDQNQYYFWTIMDASWAIRLLDGALDLSGFYISPISIITAVMELQKQGLMFHP